jgi:hypothetical protein
MMIINLVALHRSASANAGPSSCRLDEGAGMKLYTYWRSTSSYRVRIALALKKLEATDQTNCCKSFWDRASLPGLFPVCG